MDKVATLLWILFAIGAFVFRLIKKAQETSARESRERPNRPQGAAPALPTATFQEMLRQMQARNAPASNTAPAAPLPQPAAPRTLGGRLMPREAARPARSQERTELRPNSLEAPATARPRYAAAAPARRSSAMPRASTQPAYEPNRLPLAASAGAPLNETVRQMLRQPEGVRAAFVLSEIFQCKY